MRSFIITSLPVALAFTTPAQAIQCDRQYQIVDGRHVATPYCADKFLAEVARERGINVTDNELRQSEGAKVDVCKQIGMDDRLRTICINYFPYPGSND